MRRVIQSLTLAACAATMAAAAAAQETNPYLGKVYSRRLCGDCHAITVEQGRSPDPKAPAFPAIGNTPGMTTLALSAWMYSMHPTMPNIMLTTDQGEHIFAYILSLKTRDQAAVKP